MIDSQSYIEVTAQVTPMEPWSDLLIDQLGEIGFESFEETHNGFKAYIPSQNFEQKRLDSIQLTGDNMTQVVFEFKVRVLNPQNWNEVWESNFEPVDVDGTCYIRAPFHAPGSGYPYEIVIEPKMSFGTGHHESTKLMVQSVMEMDLAGRNVLDIGCGTGILAILAHKKGATNVIAIDNYIFAYHNAVENAGRNNANEIKVIHGDALSIGHRQFDVILANITRNVLIEDMKIYSTALVPGGIICMSGFYASDIDELTIEAQKYRLQYISTKQMKEWAAVKFKKY